MTTSPNTSSRHPPLPFRRNRPDRFGFSRAPKAPGLLARKTGAGALLRLFLTSACLAALGAREPLLAQNVTDPARCPPMESMTVSESDRDRRLGWWREARFGVFVHWGVYSALEGSWRGQANYGYAEHIQRKFRIPISVYREEVAGNFNPVRYDAEDWVALAKAAGAGYFVVTAKHHDGFAMFDSRANDYTIVRSTPYARDPMPALRDACRRAGIRFGFYYSHAFDWGEADAPGNDWDYSNPGGDLLIGGADWWLENPAFLARARRYVDEKAIPQVLELIRNYQPDILWFDTPHKLPVEENLRILAAVRAAGPDVVVNGRILSGKYQNQGLTDYRNTTDKPAEFPRQTGDWEAIPTTNESYGYNANDLSHKPASHFIRLLAKASARGGNTLVNLGPRGDGSIDPRDRTIFESVGAWWKTNGESIRGTTATPLPAQVWGESTRRGNRLYLHVFQWPADGRLVVGGLLSPIARARLLAAPERDLPRDGNTILLPPAPTDPVDTVVAVDFDEAPRAEPVRALSDHYPEDILRSFDAELRGRLTTGPGKESDAWVQNWRQSSDAVVWRVRAPAPMVFEVEVAYDAPEPSGEKVEEGDAGKERSKARSGAAGRYVVEVADRALEGTVRPGKRVTDPLGRLSFPAGDYDIRVRAAAIDGEELFRLRHLRLVPVSVTDTASPSPSRFPGLRVSDP